MNLDIEDLNNRQSFKTIIHPYIPAMANHVEEWLTKMSENGFALVSMRGWKFVFKKLSPKTRRYFMWYALPKDKKMLNDFVYYENKIGLKKTVLSKESNIFEIDLNEVGYEHFLNLRNKNYFSYYLKLCLFSLSLIILSIVFGFIFKNIMWVGTLYIIPFCYSIISLLLLRKKRDKVYLNSLNSP